MLLRTSMKLGKIHRPALRPRFDPDAGVSPYRDITFEDVPLRRSRLLALHLTATGILLLLGAAWIWAGVYAIGGVSEPEAQVRTSAIISGLGVAGALFFVSSWSQIVTGEGRPVDRALVRLGGARALAGALLFFVALPCLDLGWFFVGYGISKGSDRVDVPLVAPFFATPILFFAAFVVRAAVVVLRVGHGRAVKVEEGAATSALAGAAKWQ